jgi:ABC-type Fe3+ transport system substrate-binding protein
MMEEWMKHLTVLIATLCATVRCATLAHALSAEEIALLNRADRQKILEEGAKKEGKLVWYTPLIVNQAVRPLKEAFEKKYPFIKVDFHRANSRGLVQKWFTENEAKRHEADVVGGSEVTMLGKKTGLLLRFTSPYLRDYPSELKDPQGFWSSTNLYFMTLAYNTRRIKPVEAPKTYDDLLNPKWKGRMAWHMGSNTGAPLFIGNILATLGPKAGSTYLQNLAKQSITSATASARGIVDLVVAGEYDIAINIFNNHAEISKNAGAPVDWQPLEPVPSPLGTTGVAKNAPRPHAAMLFTDFLLSEEGQNVFQRADYLPAHPKVPAKTMELKPGGGKFVKANFFHPENVLENSDKWLALQDKIFTK